MVAARLHGPIWRAAGDRDFESFDDRPHENGNPDAVQYSLMFNGIGGFQLYHGEGYWAELESSRWVSGSRSASPSTARGRRSTWPTSLPSRSAG